MASSDETLAKVEELAQAVVKATEGSPTHQDAVPISEYAQELDHEGDLPEGEDEDEDQE